MALVKLVVDREGRERTFISDDRAEGKDRREEEVGGVEVPVVANEGRRGVVRPIVANGCRGFV